MLIIFTFKNCVLKSATFQISACIKQCHVYQVQHQKLCIQIKKVLKLVLVSSHIFFIIFTIKNCVLKSGNSSNYCWNQPMSCLSGLVSKIVTSNQQSSEISAGIKLCHVYHLYNQKLCLEISKVLKLVLVSSHIMFIRFSIQNCVLKSKNS